VKWTNSSRSIKTAKPKHRKPGQSKKSFAGVIAQLGDDVAADFSTAGLYPKENWFKAYQTPARKTKQLLLATKPTKLNRRRTPFCHLFTNRSCSPQS
jgi:hypothetical protein